MGMSCFIKRTYVDLKAKGVTEEILLEIFGYGEQSAKELLDGIIPFKKSELRKVAEYIGVSMEELTNNEKVI